MADLRYRAFNHLNYEDPDINVAIPVFSIHGNHDDPSGVRSFLGGEVIKRLHLLGRPSSSSRFATDLWTGQLLWTNPRIR